MNILLGVTGSVAATITYKMVESLKTIGDVKVVATNAGKYFIDQTDHKVDYLIDADEWPEKFDSDDGVLHINLRRWADCMIIAPLSANTLAKIANGLSDNLLMCTYRAWDVTKPIIVAPAMNTYMWNNNITAEHISKLMNVGITIVQPIEKKLACGDIGVGAMAKVDDITNALRKILTWNMPVKSTYLPVGNHPGAFGCRRKHDTHTGVDLYTSDGANVYAVEPGIVTNISWFTGPKAKYDWWEDTQALMVEGKSGVVLYGEISTKLNVGDIVKKGSLIGNVKRVLPEHKLRQDIKGHSTSMLHIELYEKGYRGDHALWLTEKPPALLDPTEYLKSINTYEVIDGI
jgi:phosphopantothenoylcysteine decarboxylase